MCGGNKQLLEGVVKRDGIVTDSNGASTNPMVGKRDHKAFLHRFKRQVAINPAFLNMEVREEILADRVQYVAEYCRRLRWTWEQNV